MATNVGEMYVNLKLEIKDLKKGLNQATRELRKMSNNTGKSASGVDKLNKSMRTNAKVSKEAARQSKNYQDSMVSRIRRMETMAVAYVALRKVYTSIIHEGVTLNKMYEDQSLGIAALISAKTQMVTATGEELNSYDKFIAAQQMTLDTMDDIKKAALSTPASFQEMVGFYQQTVGHAIDQNKSFGSSMTEINANVIEFTKRMSSLGAAAGMEMPKINEEIRSLMSGNASTDSLLAMLLFGSPAAANKVVREAKKKMNGLSDAVLGALEPFKNLENVDTYTKSFARMQAAMDDVRREGAKPLFDDLKKLYDFIGGENVSNKEWMVNMFHKAYLNLKLLVFTVREGLNAIEDTVRGLLPTFGSVGSSFGIWIDMLNIIRKALVGIQLLAINIAQAINNVKIGLTQAKVDWADMKRNKLGMGAQNLDKDELGQLKSINNLIKAGIPLRQKQVDIKLELMDKQGKFLKDTQGERDAVGTLLDLNNEKLDLIEQQVEVSKLTTAEADKNFKVEQRSIGLQFKNLELIRESSNIQEATAAMQAARRDANDDTGRLNEIMKVHQDTLTLLKVKARMEGGTVNALGKILEEEKKIEKVKAKGRAAAKKSGGANAAMKKAAAERAKIAKKEAADFKKRMEEYQAEIDKFTDSLSGAFTDSFDSLIEGDFGGALEDLFDGILDGMVSPFTEALGDYFGKMFAEMILGKKAYAAVAAATDATEATSKGLLAVLNAGTNGDGYTAIARMAAMAAVVASLGVAIGGSFGGGSGVSEADLAAAEGITGVQSESANNGIDIIARNSTTGLKYSEEMAASLRQLVGLTDRASAELGNEFSGENYVARNTDGIWGGSSRELLSTGIKIHPASLKEIEAGYLKGTEYTMEKVTKSSWFGLKNKESISESYGGEVDSGVMDAISAAYIRGVDVMKSAAESLGMSADEFDAVSAQWEIALSQLNMEGMDAQQRSEAIMGVISNDLDRWGETLGQVSLYIDQFKLAGEGSAETLIRLANDFEVVERSFRDMGLVLPDVAAGGLAVSQSLIQAAGGLDNYASAMSMFMNTFYTEEERMAASMRNLEISFAAVGLTVPATREAMKVMVERLHLDLVLAQQSMAVAQQKYDAEAQLLVQTLKNSNLTAQAALVASGAADAAAAQLDKAARLVTKLEGQIAAVMNNMNSISDIYGDSSYDIKDVASAIDDVGTAAGSTATACNSAAEALEIVYASLTDIAGLKSQWVDDLPGAQMVLDATRNETGLTGLTFENFLEKFTAASAGGGMTSDEFGKWSSMSSALRAYNTIIESLEKDRLEEEKKKLEAEKKVLNEQLKFYEDIMKRIDSAYGGSLSYMNSIEKADYFERRAEVDINSGDSKAYFDSLSKQLEYEKAMSITKEEYIPLFDEYIKNLKDAEPEKTTDDVVDSLEDINKKIDELKDTIEASSYQGEI